MVAPLRGGFSNVVGSTQMLSLHQGRGDCRKRAINSTAVPAAITFGPFRDDPGSHNLERLAVRQVTVTNPGFHWERLRRQPNSWHWLTERFSVPALAYM